MKRMGFNLLHIPSSCFPHASGYSKALVLAVNFNHCFKYNSFAGGYNQLNKNYFSFLEDNII